LYFLNSIEGEADAASGKDEYLVACPEFSGGLKPWHHQPMAACLKMAVFTDLQGMYFV
jgi:hypothetical protein